MEGLLEREAVRTEQRLALPLRATSTLLHELCRLEQRGGLVPQRPRKPNKRGYEDIRDHPALDRRQRNDRDGGELCQLGLAHPGSLAQACDVGANVANFWLPRFHPVGWLSGWQRHKNKVRVYFCRKGGRIKQWASFSRRSRQSPRWTPWRGWPQPLQRARSSPTQAPCCSQLSSVTPYRMRAGHDVAQVGHQVEPKQAAGAEDRVRDGSPVSAGV